jgi:tetratricopeptide (TPR) repeat protein
MKDVFELQDEIARKIADALRVTLTPQEEQALALKPTADANAYDVYLRGKSYARRLTLKDLEFALQMFENAVVIDPRFALAHAAIANVCAQFHNYYDRDPKWIDRAVAAAQRAAQLQANLPEVLVAESWILHTESKHDEAIEKLKAVIERSPGTDGVYYLLGRSLFATGRYQEAVEMAEDAIKAAGDDYNMYVPIAMAMGALGKQEAQRNLMVRHIEVLEAHLRNVPDDARARSLLAMDFAIMGRVEDADREVDMAMALRPSDGVILYILACILCRLDRKEEGMNALRRAAKGGFVDGSWARRDPDLQILHGDPEFERLFPPTYE